jgi:hypothetical protein
MKKTKTSVHSVLPDQISERDFQEMVRKGLVVDGRAGGLILGRDYENGGIYVVMKVGTGYCLHSIVEGGEYALNWEASALNAFRLDQINAGLVEDEEPPTYDLAGVVRCLTTTANPDDKLLLLHWGQKVISREAASKHIQELMQINSAVNSFTNCDLLKVFRPDFVESGRN